MDIRKRGFPFTKPNGAAAVKKFKSGLLSLLPSQLHLSFLNLASLGDRIFCNGLVKVSQVFWVVRGRVVVLGLWWGLSSLGVYLVADCGCVVEMGQVVVVGCSVAVVSFYDGLVVVLGGVVPEALFVRLSGVVCVSVVGGGLRVVLGCGALGRRIGCVCSVVCVGWVVLGWVGMGAVLSCLVYRCRVVAWCFSVEGVVWVGVVVVMVLRGALVGVLVDLVVIVVWGYVCVVWGCIAVLLAGGVVGVVVWCGGRGGCGVLDRARVEFLVAVRRCWVSVGACWVGGGGGCGVVRWCGVGRGGGKGVVGCGWVWRVGVVWVCVGGYVWGLSGSLWCEMVWCWSLWVGVLWVYVGPMCLGLVAYVWWGGLWVGWCGFVVWSGGGWLWRLWGGVVGVVGRSGAFVWIGVVWGREGWVVWSRMVHVCVCGGKEGGLVLGVCWGRCGLCVVGGGVGSWGGCGGCCGCVWWLFCDSGRLVWVRWFGVVSVVTDVGVDVVLGCGVGLGVISVLRDCWVWWVGLGYSGVGSRVVSGCEWSVRWCGMVGVWGCGVVGVFDVRVGLCVLGWVLFGWCRGLCWGSCGVGLVVGAGVGVVGGLGGVWFYGEWCLCDGVVCVINGSGVVGLGCVVFELDGGELSLLVLWSLCGGVELRCVWGGILGFDWLVVSCMRGFECCLWAVVCLGWVVVWFCDCGVVACIRQLLGVLVVCCW
ncbi:hypothetical protein Tco_1538662 [Tanacetum coccineum]